MVELIFFGVLVLSIPLALAGGSVVLAMLAAPRGRRTPVKRRRLLWGAVPVLAGTGAMARIAWATREDGYHDDFESALLMLAALLAGAVLSLGLGPFVPWLLKLPARFAGRLPRPLRLPAQELAGHPVGTAGWAAVTVLGVGAAVAVTVFVGAVLAQGRAYYYPEARPGALVVNVYSPEGAAAARATLRQEFPSVPLTQSVESTGGWVSCDLDDDSEWHDPYIGDRALLRYLTGDLSTPYDENTVVLVTTEDTAVTSAQLTYSLTTPADERLRKTVPAITVRPADARRDDVFIPAKLVEDLGFDLRPAKLIIDPSFHRVTAAEQERLDDRLGDDMASYVERGYQPSTGWLYFVGAMALAALGGALAATVAAGRSLWWRRIRWRVTGGSGLGMRATAASRAWLITACAASLGAAAGVVAGLLIAWPMTTPIGWEALPRVAFDPPWLPIVAAVAALPLVAAALAALLPPGSPDSE